jgi:gamma-glutamyl-gamma-aminobutyrate hydrolase PuuD
MPLDRARDDTTLPLVRAAVAAGVPVLAICREFKSLTSPWAARCIKIRRPAERPYPSGQYA